MKLFVIFLAVASVAHGKVVEVPDNHSAYGYLMNSIKETQRLQQLAEGYQSRIIGGVPAALGQYPFQAAVFIDLVGIEEGRGICGGSLISANRVITAAHCWFDGRHQGWRVEVALGTVTLFSGGNRQFTSAVITHNNWLPLLVRNDVAVIYLPNQVQTSNTIAPVALPSGPVLNEDFAGSNAIAAGFGLTSNAGTIERDQVLMHVGLRVIANNVCSFAFPSVLQASNVCTSGIGTVGACRGDSGGPLIVTRNNVPVLIGVTSFGNGLVGCEGGFPTVFARVTSFMDFFRLHL